MLEKQISIHLTIGGPSKKGGPPSKVTKSEANYRPSDGEFCRDCRFYTGNYCEVVAGRIQPMYISDFYEPKNAERTNRN